MSIVRDYRRRCAFGTLYRTHGSNEADTIGQAVSSGCIWMTNDDVVELYDRTGIGATAIVMR